MLALSWTSVDQVRGDIRATRRLTDRPFGINLVLEWDQRERLAAALDEGARIVSLTWGEPDEYLRLAHRAGAFVLHTVGSAAEARRLVEAGVDAVVAQAWEAGGHVRSEVGLSVLIPAVCDAVGDVPVVAAGGIADGRGIAAALLLGAQAAWIGTRFLATTEARVHSVYHDRILAADETSTAFSTLFDIGWPAAPHRTLRNSTFESWRAAGRPSPPVRPGESEVVAWTEAGEPIRRYEDTIPTPGTTGAVEALALYAGQSAGLIHDVVPAAALVRRLADQTRAAFDRAKIPA
jgi:NAD(P)H-dependent flavin oxidoreductase YrpB (nitropropane dioxygenase family)